MAGNKKNHKTWKWKLTALLLVAAINVSVFGFVSQSSEMKKLSEGWVMVDAGNPVPWDTNQVLTQDTWYYVVNGEPSRNRLVNIAGKTYGFDSEGHMVKGLCAAIKTAVGGFIEFKAQDINSESDLNEYCRFNAGYIMYCFSKEEGSLGVMLTGEQELSIDGRKMKFYFIDHLENYGVGLNGKHGNSFYVNGRRITAKEEAGTYQLFRVVGNRYAYGDAEVIREGAVYPVTDYVLIDKAGEIVTGGRKNDGNGTRYIYHEKTSAYPYGYWTAEHV